ncbi:MAG: hypothetical protein SVG88_03605 [Halobacteriales archaeon]|nr:hypothetical protein [Halobacteriales archaeon]
MGGSSDRGRTSLAYKQGQALRDLPGGKTVLDAKVFTYQLGADAFEYVLTSVGLDELANDIRADAERSIEQSKAGYKGRDPPR